MGIENNLGEQLRSTATESLPLLSGGQQHAIEEFASIIEIYLGQPVTIRFMEAVGEAGKTMLITSIKRDLASLGIAVIEDTILPADYRAQTGHMGPIVATGRIFGTHSPEDVTINVAGFSVDELDRLLAPTVKDQQLRHDIARYSIGSIGIARTIAGHAGTIDKTGQYSIKMQYFARIAASFLCDRIPDYMLKKGPDFIEPLINDMYARYIPDSDLEHEKQMIMTALEELSGEGFAHLEGLLAKLGSDISISKKSINPVEIITTEMQHGGTRYSYPYEYKDITRLIEQVRKAQELSSQAAISENLTTLPLYTFLSTRQALRDVITGSIEGVEGLHSEPRFRIVASIPHDGIERITLEKCMENCIRYPLQSAMRKTALAIFPPQQRDGTRLSAWNISREGQFFERINSGEERHSFFLPEFAALEEILDLVSGKTDRLFFLSGDHSKIPMVPTIITDLVLESILQQLGYPYLVQYINRPYIYNPENKTLEAI
jgi:hypothetical protein